jgi:hypothetical protein
VVTGFNTVQIHILTDAAFELLNFYSQLLLNFYTRCSRCFPRAD